MRATTRRSRARGHELHRQGTARAAWPRALRTGRRSGSPHELPLAALARLANHERVSNTLVGRDPAGPPRVPHRDVDDERKRDHHRDVDEEPALEAARLEPQGDVLGGAAEE